MSFPAVLPTTSPALPVLQCLFVLRRAMDGLIQLRWTRSGGGGYFGVRSPLLRFTEEQ